jgi:hypothetical protein
MPDPHTRCPKPAEFGIHGSSDPLDRTEACTDHVGALLGSPVSGAENTHWIVWPIPTTAAAAE